MMRDITIGKYYNQDSLVHQLDCRTKLAGTLLFIIAIFLVNRPVVYIPCLLYILILYKVARIPWSYALVRCECLDFVRVVLSLQVIIIRQSHHQPR